MSLDNLLIENTMLGHTSFDNRAVVAPMTRVSTNGDGIPTDQMAAYYRRYAEGGFGLIIAEGTYTDRFFSQGYPNQPGITTDEQQAGWQKVVAAVHDAGGKIFLQLMHAGALSQHLSNTRGPSSVPPMRHMLEGYSKKQGRFPLPQAMNPSEIDDVIDGFITSANRAVQAGFDGVEIHGANGYLLDQFLTDYSNTREDQYGGSLENRCRLGVEIVKAVKEAVSNSCVVGIRLSQGKVNDFDYLWPGGIEDGKVIFALLKKAGADYIHFASEGQGFDHGCLTRDGKSLPRLARDITGLPVIANGGLHNLQEANRILSNGHSDLIAIGTGALANPDWPKKIRDQEKIRPFNPDMFSEGVTVSRQFDWESRQMNGKDKADDAA